jgi:hypothetical protein
VDFDQKRITIGKAKSVPRTGRVIPMNDELLPVMSSHANWFTEVLGEICADFCVFHRSCAS